MPLLGVYDMNRNTQLYKHAITGHIQRLCDWQSDYEACHLGSWNNGDTTVPWDVNLIKLSSTQGNKNVR